MTASEIAPQRFDAAPALAGLKPFQRDAVDHVISRFHGEQPAKRFLVADETGLGKSIVARGVIAKTIERLQDDPTIDRIDIVYICSNADLARQNLRRLNVLGDEATSFSSRLSLLATRVHALNADTARWKKPINLVSFTPGTSFESGWRSGIVNERALLFLLLRDRLDLTRGRRTAALRILQGSVRTWRRMGEYVDQFEASLSGHRIDPTIAAAFRDAIEQSLGDEPPLVQRFEALLDETRRTGSVHGEAWHEAMSIIGRMRHALATAGIDALEPDLVILDEFQRFRDLLDGESEAAELAHVMFDYPDARVLLLSATPFNPYSLAEEDGADGHRESFLRTVEFLADRCAAVNVDSVKRAFDRLRNALASGGDATGITAEIRQSLLTVMCRAERPERVLGRQTVERQLAADCVEPDDLVRYALMRRLADRLRAPLPVEYWKSAPHFANFMDGYKIKTALDDAMADPLESSAIVPYLDELPSLSAQTLAQYGRIDLGNARLRELARDTIGHGWQRLLWVPPTLQYLRPGAPYDDPEILGMTKRLLFSSWSATPTAIASLLSYEASRSIVEAGDRDFANTPEAREAFAPRLAYGLREGRPDRMTTLALFWPMPDLARLADPLAAASAAGGSLVDPAAARAAVAATLRTRGVAVPFHDAHDASDVAGLDGEGASSAERWYWATALRWSAKSNVVTWDLSDSEEMITAMSGKSTDRSGRPDGAGLAEHVRLALTIAAPVGQPPDDLTEVLADIAMHSPANCAWRALSRLDGFAGLPDLARWCAAATIAGGLRSMFNRWESTIVLDALYPAMPYWRRVLEYCAAGNLQAVLDEYLFHLADGEGIRVLDEQSIVRLADVAAGALSLRAATYQAFDPHHPAQRIPFPARFALRYGSARESEESARMPEVRQAFNSPFWPFVLASTSVGQEGIDFHWWCHSIVHWNTPANPVDFEQREGRVNRFRGHAIRRNIVARHREQILTDPGTNPWSAAYRLAAGGDMLGGLRPDWIYEGNTHIDRCVLPYPLSQDLRTLEETKRGLALYRLAFGQSRQEDLVALMELRGLDGAEVDVDALRVDLRAPARH